MTISLLMIFFGVLGIFGLLCVARGIRRLCQGKFLDAVAWSLTGYVILVFVTGTIHLYTIPVTHSHAANRCVSNLSQIAKACAMYSIDHDEAFPSSFLSLSSYVNQSTKLFMCHSLQKKPGTIETVDEWASYILVTNLSASSDSDLVLAYCKPENHQGDGVNVLFVDFSVNWIDSKDFHTLNCDILNHSRTSKKKF